MFHPMRSRLRAVRAALVLAAVLAACGGSEGPAPVAGPVVKVPIDGAPVRGSPTPTWVTVVEFSDFQCPFCRQAQPTLAQLLSAYGDDVQLAFKHFPLSFHLRAVPAALAAECARAQGRFWEMHDRVFEGQPALDDATLAAHAAAAGLDVAGWQACLATAEPVARVEADRALGAASGVRGTPTLFVNGRAVVGAVPYAELAAAVDAALAEARSSGIARERYYELGVLGR
jgi:protein-disulfide isomerase